MINTMSRTRSFQTSAMILVVVAILCTRFPLLNYLGFEFSVVIAVCAGLVSGLLTLLLWKRYSFDSITDVRLFVGRMTVLLFFISLLPLLVGFSNALFIRNCSLTEGMKFYVVIVFPTIFFCESIALCTVVVFRRWQKTLYCTVFVLLLGHIPLVTLIRPQIFAFNPIVGFFPGFSYDESLLLTSRFLTYRLMTIAAAITIFAFAIWFWQSQRRKEKYQEYERTSGAVPEVVCVSLLLPLLVVIFLFSDRIGFSSSESFIREKLGGSIRTSHFDILYPLGTIKREKIEELGILHEYYYNDLCQYLHIQPRERITSFLYATPEQKGRLIGAAHTDISKPWLHQIHINASDIESGLKHEMAHALSAEFGWSPLRIAKNSGLLEGLAVAAGDDIWYNEPLDRAAAQVVGAGVQPNIESLFRSSGFLTEYAGISYTLAGSFCKYLIRSYGVEKFKNVYSSNNFQQEYHLDLATLISEWKKHIEQQKLTYEDSVKGAYFFKRSSIFKKDCARVLANMNSKTRILFQQQEYDQALLSAENSLKLSRTPEALFQKVNALYELHRFAEIIVTVKKELLDTLMGQAIVPLYLQLGDSYWALDSIEQAEQAYTTLEKIHLSSWYEEGCSIRLAALKDLRERMDLKYLFCYTLADTVRVARLSRLSGLTSKYLLGKELASKKRYTEAQSILGNIGELKSGTLEFFRLYRLGQIYFAEMEYEKAGKIFSQALKFVPSEGLNIETQDWIHRCIFWSK